MIDKSGDEPHLWNCCAQIEAHLKKHTKTSFIAKSSQLTEPICFWLQVFISRRHAEVSRTSACWIWKILFAPLADKGGVTIHLKWEMTYNFPGSIFGYYCSSELSGDPCKMLIKSCLSLCWTTLHGNGQSLLEKHFNSIIPSAGQNRTCISETHQVWALLCLNIWWGWTHT